MTTRMRTTTIIDEKNEDEDEDEDDVWPTPTHPHETAEAKVLLFPIDTNT